MNTFVFALAVFYAGMFGAPAELGGYELLMTNSYHGDEIKAVSGEKWWGLFLTNKGHELRPVTIRVDIVRDGCLDSDDAHKTGKEICVEGKQEGRCLFLVKGPWKVKPGPVRTFFSGRIQLSLSCDEPLLSKQGGFYGEFQTDDSTTFRIQASGSMRNLGEDYEITVATHKASAECVVRHVEQSLFHSNVAFGIGAPTLLWVGDIDQDGNPDLLINLTTRYDQQAPTLFLSSEAGPGELVKGVAVILSSAC